MRITYIHHSSFLAELPEVNLLFDYYAGEIPKMDEDKPLVVFASHSHGDHFSPRIFQLAQAYHRIAFVLSFDIHRKKVPDELLEHAFSLKDGVTFCLDLDKMAEAEVGGSGGKLQIETFKSTDEGVAFWIHCGQKQLYHAGDLNNWWWEGESEEWNHNIAADYKREIERMAGRQADVAFVPLDPRQEQWFYLGMDEFMKKVDAKAVLPMHFWEDYSIIEKMKEHPCSESYRDRIITIQREGEEFTL